MPPVGAMPLGTTLSCKSAYLDLSKTYEGHCGNDIKKKCWDEETLTAIPQAEGEAAPACALALLR